VLDETEVDVEALEEVAVVVEDEKFVEVVVVVVVLTVIVMIGLWAPLIAKYRVCMPGASCVLK